MPFIKSFSVITDRQHPWPFDIPAVKFAQRIDLDNPVTILVGDNGTGKSTLLETLAVKLNLPLIGGAIGRHPGFEAARSLQSLMQLEWKRQTNKGFFFRAEDFSDFLNSVERERNKIAGDLRELEGKVDQSIIDQMSEGMNYNLYYTRKNYGDNLQAYSHGEAYLKILQMRIPGKGVYLLDEPEAALSPLKQLSLLSFIMERLKKGDAQFIIATHSPIIMGLPKATLYQILETGMNKVKFRETEHYSITKNFLDNPDAFLRYL
jgi:predicted ATPase